MIAKTNITDEIRDAFNALFSEKYGRPCLFSCFLDGKPTAAICTVSKAEDGDYLITPLFVAVTEDMVLTDHDGNRSEYYSEQERGGKAAPEG